MCSVLPSTKHARKRTGAGIPPTNDRHSAWFEANRQTDGKPDCNIQQRGANNFKQVCMHQQHLASTASSRPHRAEKELEGNNITR
jgi:hypothetical protein